MACGGVGGCGAGGGVGGVGGGGSRRYFKCKVIPEPDRSGSGIHWTVRTAPCEYITVTPPPIEYNQPDRNRTVMGAKFSKGRIDYYYTDRYEYHRRVMSIATVLCCVVATPLTLICTIPMAHYWNKVSKFKYCMNPLPSHASISTVNFT